MKLKKFYIIFYFTVLALNAQEPVSIHLTEKDGLPDIEFYDILEDHQGFIWLAADKGLYRYDGKNYKLYTHPLKRGRSLFYLTLDTKGRIWCNNLAGQFFYIENDILVLFKDFEFINTLADFNIFKNHLVIRNGTEIYAINIESKKIVNTLKEISEDYLVDLNNKSDGVYFIKNQYLNYTENSNLSEYYSISSEQISPKTHRGSNKFFKYKNHVLFFQSSLLTGENKLFRFEQEKIIQIVLPEELLNIRIVHAYEIENQLWVLTQNGIYVLDIRKNKAVILKHYLKNIYTTDLLIDKNKNYWITTLKNGIFVLPNLELKRITTPLNIGINTMDLATNKKVYFATTSGNIYSYNTVSNKLKNFSIKLESQVHGICKNQYSQDILIIGNSESLIYNELNQSKQKSSVLVTKSIVPLNENNYLLSLPHSLAIYNKKKDTIVDIHQVRSYGSVINKQQTKAYSNFTTGLAKVDLKTGDLTPLLHQKKPVFASKIVIDEKEVIWVATYSNGLYGFKNDQLIYQFDIANGLLSRVINAIEVTNNSVWVATDKGIQNYNYLTKTNSIIDRQDGVNSYNINAIKVLDNQVFFSSNTGLYQFDSNKINKNRKILKPYFTGVAIQEKDTILAKSYTLKQTDSEIKISFNVNGFQSQSFTDYQYQLSGFNSKWIPIENGLDFVKFNTLPEGVFNFKLRAKNSKEETFSKPISIALTITSPFYKTWWFLAFVFGISLFFVWLFYKQKTKRLKAAQVRELENAKINQQLVFSQLENLRSQMNPHFIFNALNSIQDYIILNEKKLARIYLVKFSRLIRTYLEHSQKNEITLKEEINALQLYLELEKDRFDDDFKFELSIDPKLDLDHTLVPSLFIQPYVENALKHGLLHKKEDKQLHLNFKLNQTHQVLVCEIIDNGVGRKTASEIKKNRTEYHKSFASSANQKRVNLLNKAQHKKIEVSIEDLYNPNQIASGTKVLIVIHLPEN